MIRVKRKTAVPQRNPPRDKSAVPKRADEMSAGVAEAVRRVSADPIAMAVFGAVVQGIDTRRGVVVGWPIRLAHNAKSSTNDKFVISLTLLRCVMDATWPERSSCISAFDLIIALQKVPHEDTRDIQLLASTWQILPVATYGKEADVVTALREPLVQMVCSSTCVVYGARVFKMFYRLLRPLLEIPTWPSLKPESFRALRHAKTQRMYGCDNSSSSKSHALTKRESSKELKMAWCTPLWRDILEMPVVMQFFDMSRPCHVKAMAPVGGRVLSYAESTR